MVLRVSENNLQEASVVRFDKKEHGSAAKDGLHKFAGSSPDTSDRNKGMKPETDHRISAKLESSGEILLHLMI